MPREIDLNKDYFIYEIAYRWRNWFIEYLPADVRLERDKYKRELESCEYVKHLIDEGFLHSNIIEKEVSYYNLYNDYGDFSGTLYIGGETSNEVKLKRFIIVNGIYIEKFENLHFEIQQFNNLETKTIHSLRMPSNMDFWSSIINECYKDLTQKKPEPLILWNHLLSEKFLKSYNLVYDTKKREVRDYHKSESPLNRDNFIKRFKRYLDSTFQ